MMIIRDLIVPVDRRDRVAGWLSRDGWRLIEVVGYNRGVGYQVRARRSASPQCDNIAMLLMEELLRVE